MTRPVDEMTPDAWVEAFQAVADAGKIGADGKPTWAPDCAEWIHLRAKFNHRDALIERACREGLSNG